MGLPILQYILYIRSSFHLRDVVKIRTTFSISVRSL